MHCPIYRWCAQTPGYPARAPASAPPSAKAAGSKRQEERWDAVCSLVLSLTQHTFTYGTYICLPSTVGFSQRDAGVGTGFRRGAASSHHQVCECPSPTKGWPSCGLCIPPHSLFQGLGHYKGDLLLSASSVSPFLIHHSLQPAKHALLSSKNPHPSPCPSPAPSPISAPWSPPSPPHTPAFRLMPHTPHLLSSHSSSHLCPLPHLSRCAS